jgi:Transposase DDE domain
MQNSNNDGFDHHDKAQAAVEQDSCLIVASTLSNHPNDQAEAIPTLDAIPLALGKPQAGALDHGYVSATNIAAMEARDLEPYIATGRLPLHPSWQSYFAQQPAPPPADASPKIQMAYKLQTEIGGAIYRLRTCTVEPVLGMLKDILGFRQCSLRGWWAAAGAWCVVCMACNLKRLHTLTVR